MSEDWIGALAIILMFGFAPVIIFMRKPLQQLMAQRERREARQLFERLTMEKIDIIKTAVAVGMKKEDLADLDTRLERLIGIDQMKTLLLQEDPNVPGAELGGLELDREALAAAKRRAQRQ
jgi:hypothetical protein